MSAGVNLHPIAEDDGGRNLVDDLSAVARRVAGLIKDLVGCDRGKALVEEFNGKVGASAEFVCKFLDLGGPR